MKNQKLITYGIIAFVALVAIGYAYPTIAAYLNYQKVDVAPAQAKAKQVSCDVSVANPFGIPLVRNGDFYIASANCQQQYVNNCGRFGVFSQQGSLRLEASGGLGSATDVSVGEGSSASYTLTWCGSTNTQNFNIKLYNGGNDLLYTKVVNLQ